MMFSGMVFSWHFILNEKHPQLRWHSWVYDTQRTVPLHVEKSVHGVSSVTHEEHKHSWIVN